MRQGRQGDKEENLMMLFLTVHIYLPRRDLALGVSETTKNPANRLGKYRSSF